MIRIKKKQRLSTVSLYFVVDALQLKSILWHVWHQAAKWSDLLHLSFLNETLSNSSSCNCLIFLKPARRKKRGSSPFNPLLQTLLGYESFNPVDFPEEVATDLLLLPSCGSSDSHHRVLNHKFVVRNWPMTFYLSLIIFSKHWKNTWITLLVSLFDRSKLWRIKSPN